MKLTTKRLKQLILEELQQTEQPPEQEEMQGDVKNVLGQFKSTIQGYLDKIDNPAELTQMLNVFLGMLKQKGISGAQIDTVLTKLKDMQRQQGE